MTPREALPPGALRVLLVEDNAINEVVALGLLRKLGCRDIFVARDGHEAVAFAAHGNFDLILMDCHMPRMDGFEATRTIRAAGCRVPIVALTADVTATARQMCLDAGMDDYLTKPVSLADLRLVLTRAADTDAAVPFSRDALLEQFGGDEELVTAALRIFRTNTPRTLERLQAAVDAIDRSAIRLLAHTVKGSALMVGAEELAAAAGRLERASEGAESAELAVTLQRLRRVFGGVVRQLEADEEEGCTGFDVVSDTQQGMSRISFPR